jgi:hypothetical protein
MNRWGWGPFSPEPHTEILAATIPEKVPIPQTSINPADGGVLIAWDAPYENGSAITQYSIEILDSSDLWNQAAECDGSLASVVAARQCVVPMDTLTSLYGYQFDELVLVRISATNLLGQGPWSGSNSEGAKIRARPAQMETVVIGALSTSN